MKPAPLLFGAFALAACGSNKGPGRTASPEILAPSVADASASPPPLSSSDPTGPGTGSREARLIARMLRRVEAARGMTALRPVPGILLERSALIARVKEHVASELPPEAIRNEGLALQLFGFIPTRFDYEAAQYRLLQDQLAGYYEPADGTMYMASDLGQEEAEATLAHELVHALQDQRWDLEARSKYRAGAGDRSEAASALAEGDATSAMFDVLIAGATKQDSRTALDLPDDVFVEQIRQGMAQGPGAEAPRVMRTSLAAPYIYGTLFVHALRRRGGWTTVDHAWDESPTTTEQILHLEKWLAREAALKVAAPTFGALGTGWKVADEDSEGELGTRIAFEEWMDAAAAATASAGWGGDRGVLVANGERIAFAWRLRYDSGGPLDSLAARAYAVLRRALDQSLGPTRTSDAWFTCRERPDRGPLAVAQNGADLVFVLGPARSHLGSWTSAGDCALARRWTREIESTK